MTALNPTFAKLGVRDEIVRALAEIGIERTFAIQEMTLPVALAGDDIIGQARTGTGKTLGFGVPLLHRSSATGDDQPAARRRPLPASPARSSSCRPASCACRSPATCQAPPRPQAADRPLSVVAIYGGRAYEPQIEALRAGVDVVVGTPGRLLDLAQQGHLRPRQGRVLVLDEADEMLDLGFLPDVERILRHDPRRPPDDAVLGHHARPDHRAGPPFMTQPTHIRAEAPHDLGGARHAPRSSSTARTRWTRSSCSPASCRPRAAARR